MQLPPLACIFDRWLRWRWRWLLHWLLLHQPQRQREACPCWQQWSPDELEQLRPIYLLRAALPLQQLRDVLVRMEAPVKRGWQLHIRFDPAGR